MPTWHPQSGSREVDAGAQSDFSLVQNYSLGDDAAHSGCGLFH